MKTKNELKDLIRIWHNEKVIEETMVFKGEEHSIVYFESHGYELNPKILMKEHERIVDAIKKGEINLEEE